MSDTTVTDVARAAPAEADRLGEVLARAFHDDPVFTWVLPRPEARRDRLPSFFALFAEAFAPHGETYLTADGTGAALWAPAGVEPIGPQQAEEFGARLASILQEDAERGVHVEEVLEAYHPEEDCFYLQFVGVLPEHQGRGLGSRLLTTVLQRCDAGGIPAYLEATSPLNRRLYERHGFETMAEIALPAGPSLWPMWRRSRTR